MRTEISDDGKFNRKIRKREFIFRYYSHLPDEWQGRLLRKTLTQAKGAPVTVHYIVINEAD
jgi:hypothetical protein